MTVITKTSGGACLQLGLGERLAAPEPPSLRLVQVGADESVTSVGRAPSPAELDFYIVPGTGGHGRARTDGLLAVVEAFACRVAVIGYDASRHDKFLIMAAARPVLDALEILLPRIARQMEAAARAAAKAYGADVRSALPDMPCGARRGGLNVPYFRDYLRGYGKGIAENIRGIRGEAIQAGGPELARMLAAQDRLADEMYRAEFPDTQRLRPESGGHENGHEAGLDAGLKADLGDEYLLQHDLIFAML
jgi:hypothetical protein